MNLPNKLTIARIILTGFFLGVIIKPEIYNKCLALLFFSAATITDYLDGYIARKYQLISNFGKIMDPIADKLLVLCAFYSFLLFGLVEPWMFIVIFIREVGVTALRLMVIKKGTVLAAESAGKWKTVVQMVAIYFILLYMIIQSSHQFAYLTTYYQKIWLFTIYILMVAAVFLTVFSGASFLWNNRKNINVR